MGLVEHYAEGNRDWAVFRYCQISYHAGAECWNTITMPQKLDANFNNPQASFGFSFHKLDYENSLRTSIMSFLEDSEEVVHALSKLVAEAQTMIAGICVMVR